MPGLFHYASSKAALEKLTRYRALELSPHSVRVNAIVAGPTESGTLTGMIELSSEQTAAIKEREREQIPLIVVRRTGGELPVKLPKLHHAAWPTDQRPSILCKVESIES